MAHQFKCIVFDVDGTLLDTSEGILSSVRYIINLFDLQPLDDETIKSFIGPPIQHSFKNIYNFKDNIISELSSAFRKRYKEEDLLLAKPYNGIYEVFEYLKSARITAAIATYKREDYALRLLKYFNFNQYTDLIYGSDLEGKLTKRDIINLALKSAGVQDNSQALMVGDSDNDAIGASEVGTNFLGVTYGFGFKKKDDVFQFKNIGAADNTNEIIDIISGGYS